MRSHPLAGLIEKRSGKVQRTQLYEYLNRIFNRLVEEQEKGDKKATTVLKELNGILSAHKIEEIQKMALDNSTRLAFYEELNREVINLIEGKKEGIIIDQIARVLLVEFFESTAFTQNLKDVDQMKRNFEILVRESEK